MKYGEIVLTSEKNILLRPATVSDQPVLVDLARRIWTATYRGLITDSQIDYMIDWMYSETTLARELDSGVRWDILYAEGNPAGYLSYETVEPLTVRLHKIYLLPDQQGKSLGRRMIERVETFAKDSGASRIVLTVNKGNERAQAFYRRCGFETIDSIVKDIGNGFIMDDYLMEKKLRPSGNMT